MSLGVAQQVGTKNDGQNSKDKQLATHAIIFIYFPDFSSYHCFFAIFYFLNYYFYIFP
jgi:hypothetical protein